jgi:DNA gyrase/topoisomerase IV subunit B
MEYKQSYRKGRPLTDLQEQKLAKKDPQKTGTEVAFLFDRAVFSKG